MGLHRRLAALIRDWLELPAPVQAAPEPSAVEPPTPPCPPPPEDSQEERLRALEAEKNRLQSALHTAVDPFVAQLVLENRITNEKRRATVMFADLVAFTEASEKRPPEAIIEEVDILFSAMEPILRRFRGHLDKYMGDALMAEFGAPHPACNHALMAALAAVRMQERMRDWDFPWKMRIGLASGTIVVGLMGSGSRKNYTAIGDKVNLASRLQQICPTGAIWVDEEVQTAIHRWFRLERVRLGLSAEEVRSLEARLVQLKEALQANPTPRTYSEAANVCSELGDMEQALQFHKRSLELYPESGPTEHALSATLLAGDERSYVTIKGKKQKVAVYEVLGLKDLILEGHRFPHCVVEAARGVGQEVSVPEEWMLCIEAMEGTLGHGQATAALSAALAKALGESDAVVRKAYLAGYLHDIGKKSVPEHLLNYAGPLSDLPAHDRDLLTGHVGAAEAVLKELKIPVSPDVLAGILQHHESFDGTGYPKGLKGKDISLLARIIRVAETYDTLTSWHPYREPWTTEATLGEIGRDINRRRVDPEIGEVFLRMMGVNQISNPLKPPTVDLQPQDNAKKSPSA